MKRTLLVVAGGIAALVVLAIAASLFGGNDALVVRSATVERRDLVSTVSAGGNIRARRQVDISSDISARVVELLVDEGDLVEPGQVLLRLERTQFEAALQRQQASLSQARAQLTQVRASRTRAQRTFDRTVQLLNASPPIVSQQEYEEAETALQVANANLEAAEFSVQQAQAGVAEADDRLARTTITAPIAGRVTRLNVEEGETVIVGTMNNPGSLVLSISDLSIIEVVVEVDETEVPRLALGDSAKVEIDAFPGRDFSGRVTQIGNSAIRPPTGGGGQSAIDFEVVITIDDPGVELRPDLSATAQIVTERVNDAVSVPIIAVTVRDRSVVDSTRFALPPIAPGDFQDVEGVFVIEGGTVTFRPVRLGITGAEHFEVVSGLEPGLTVVAGPFQVVRLLENGDPVRVGDPEMIEE